MTDSWYDVAQICLNGHVVNDSVRSRPQHNKNFCDKCGAATITSCKDCNADIQGYYNVPGVISVGPETQAPAFCPNCGKPYPWTKTKIQAAQDLTQELENISDEEKNILSQSIDDIVKDSPRTTLAATRFKKILIKAGSHAGAAFKDILVDVLSETAKKILWPQ